MKTVIDTGKFSITRLTEGQWIRLEMRLPGRKVTTADAVIGVEYGSESDGPKVRVNWCAIGDVSASVAADFAHGILVLSAMADAELAAWKARS